MRASLAFLLWVRWLLGDPANFALGRVLETLQVDIGARLRLSSSGEK